MTTLLARPFNDHDWMGFAGAESWGEDQPLIRELPGCCIVASKGGVEVFYFNEATQDTCSWGLLGVNPPSQAVARLLIEALPEDVEMHLVGLGFSPLI